MVVLKRIHIKNFRSIVDATIELDDFNFFVGKNDSGKSNVLKAINLFFNERTDYDTPFNFAVDYSKFAKRSIHQAKEIMIALDVQMPATFKDGGIKTWTKIWRKEGLYSDNATELFSRGTKGTTFLSRIKYMYVPAIKSADYFKYLLSQVYDSMTEVADSALKDLNKKYSSELQEVTHGLSENLQNVLHMRSDIQMPRELSTLFKDLSFSTTDKFVKNVDLNQRGDGIKARHIPSILNFMQENMEENRAKNTVSYNFIWGFEEPENGVEYSLCYEMAEELYDYRKKCQLLITTHSPAIYAIKNRDATRCYYVSKKESGATAYDTDISVDEINQKIGLMPLIAPYLMEQKTKYDDELKNLENAIEKLQEEYKQATEQIVILAEGKTDIKHLKAAFSHIDDPHGILSKISYYDFENQVLGADDLLPLLNKLASIPAKGVVYLAMFDRDKHNEEGEYRKVSENVYRFNIPALNNAERNVDDEISIEHYYTNAEIQTETGKGHLYMGKDFDEYGMSIDKNLFYSKFSHCKVLPYQIVDSGCSRIERTSERRTLCSKNDFAEYVTSNFEKFNFENFKLIYELIYKIIQENNIFAEKQ